MTNPPSHIRVSVEETENGYIVQAGSAVARISRTILGYAVDADSQVLKEEYNLSPGVEKVRKSAHTAVQFSADPTDETRLILRTQRNFLLLSQAVEMVCGFPPKDFPRESDWKLLSAWKNERDVVVEPEHAVASQIGETTTPVGVSSGEVQGEFGTTLQDIVSEVEDAVDAEYQSNSWRVIPNKSAEKFLDKSAFEFHETGVPKDVCDFFGATNLPAGSRKPINLINNSKRLTGYIIKDMTKSGRVKLRWDHEVSDTILRSQKKYGDKLSLVFFKMLDLDTYNIIVRKVVGANPGENNTIPSVVEETRSNTESDVLPSQNIGEEYSPDVLRIHEAVSKLPRYRFYKSTEIDVDNGLLVVFEYGEKYGEYDRIVYVGINKASGRLPGRIQEFISGSKDGVVLRKYIGEALLRKDGDSYARIWAKDSSSPEKLRRIGTFYDPKKEEKTESRVSSYLKKHMSFSVIEIPNSTRRSLLQDELVSTLQEAYSQSSVSSTWLGRYHSDPKIRSGALWMIGNANSRSFNEEELQTFLKEVQKSQSLEMVAKSAAPTPETVIDVSSPVEQASADDNAYSVNEEPMLDDVLQMENTDEKERILLNVVKHHLRKLGVAGSRVLALAPLLLYPGIPKSKISLSFGTAYARTAISTCIDDLITDNIITTYQYQRIGRARVTYYKFTDVDKFISDLDIQKEQKLRLVSSTLKTIINSLREEYHLPEEYYIPRFSEEYGKIQEKLINPIILLGLTKEVAQLLVYLHLFNEVTEEKVHDLLLRQLTPGKEVSFLRKLFSANWIGTKEELKKENRKWVTIQHYHLTQPLEDILLDYVLNYGEGLNNSVVELRKIITHLAEHPFIIMEGSVTRSYDEEEDEQKSDENAEFRSFSWKVNPGISAVKTLDKSAFQYHNSGVPKAVCPFFGVDKLPRGGKRTIYLNYLSKRFTGYLVRDFGGSHSVKIYWDKDFANILSEYQAINGDELSLAFIKMPETDTYNLKVAKIGNSEEEITPVPVDARREERKVESPKPQYSQNTQILPEKKVEEIVDTEIQKSVYKYSTPVGNIDNWKKLYLTVKPYRAATIKDMGADFSLYNVSDSRNRILLGNELTSIINIEGPISRQQLIQRVMDLHSIPRLGEKIEGNILYSLRVLVNQGRIQRSKDAEQEYYSSKLNPILPRKRNYVLNISFSEISPDEIRVMIISHLLKENRCMKNTLIRDVYRGLGYQSQINHDISRRIERVLHDMISDGIIKIENQKVSFVTE